MFKQNFFSKYMVPKVLFLSMTLLCWSITFFQSAARQMESGKAVPAFQNETIPDSETIPAYQNETIPGAETVPAFQNKTISLQDAKPIYQTKESQTLEIPFVSKQLTRESASNHCQSMADRLDSDAALLSSHSDKNYSDFYFFSPFLKKQLQIAPTSSTGSNLQIVFVWNNDGSCRHIYLGIPCIEYCF